MRSPTCPRRAFIYTRISKDSKGEGAGVARQRETCEARAKALGWEVVAVIEENDTSATKGPRPKYLDMMERLRRGEANALMGWSIDRLTRTPRELEDILDLASQKDVALATVYGDIDLGSPAGRSMARVAATFARQEMDTKSDRQRAANLQRAQAGRPHAGRRAFGYSPDGLAVVPDEAAEVERAAAALLAGVSIHSIARSMNDRGAKTTAGNPWKPTEVRRLLSNPRHAGIRVHNGVEVGEGTWPAILDRETHAALLAILADPSRHRAGRPRRYLLSGVAKCGVCGGKIFGVSEKRGPLYMCETRRHVVRRAEDIEGLVNDVIIERLSRPDAAELFAAPGEDQRMAQLVTEEQALNARKTGLSESFAEGLIDKAQLVAGTERVNAKLEVIHAEIASLARTPDMADLVGAEDVAAAWDAMDTDRRRAVIGLLLEVAIDSAGRGARSFKPDTVRLTWR